MKTWTPGPSSSRGSIALRNEPPPQQREQFLCLGRGAELRLR